MENISFHNNLEENIDLDKYSSTPPRTRILRRQRERKQRDKDNLNSPKTHRRGGTCFFSRRNTIDTFQSDNLEEIPSADSRESRRAEKRSMKLLRGSERDLKLDTGASPITLLSMKSDLHDDRTNSMPLMSQSQSSIQIPATLIETCNRFMSLTSRPVACRLKQKLECWQHISAVNKIPDADVSDCPKDRRNFYKKMYTLFKAGTDNKLQRQDSLKENQIWQNELKDLIWLELQAYHADRTPLEQDCYLCAERKKVGQLLDDIMNYKYTKPNENIKNCYHRQTSSTTQTDGSTDSGIEATNNIFQNNTFVECSSRDSSGCLLLYCPSCLNNQKVALKEVETLMERLENATYLYSSSKAFALQYPLYKSTEFVNKVKAMCLWYNLMKNHRLKLYLLGRFIMYLHRKYNWPIVINTNKTSSDVDDHLLEELPLPQNIYDDVITSITAEKNRHDTNADEKSVIVKFDLDCNLSNPSDSNHSSSDSPSVTQEQQHDASLGFDEDVCGEPINYLNIDAVAVLELNIRNPTTLSPYRLFIEDIIKTRGLSNALLFLENMYQGILDKTQITLQKPPKNTTFEEYCKMYCDLDKDDGTCSNSHNIEYCELRRYGSWSPEANELDLPSYRTLFLFLSLIPFRAIRAFMRMKLEQKKMKPSPLSIGQLMKELKEGLQFSAMYRKRLLLYIDTVLKPEDVEWNDFQKIIDDLDKDVKSVFEIYICYLEQWSLMVLYENFQKNMIEDEWVFMKTVHTQIPDTKGFIVRKLCQIVGAMIDCIVETIGLRVSELESSIHASIAATEGSERRHCMWFVCRKLQKIINEERERSLKVLAITKLLRKEFLDVEYINDCEIKKEVYLGLGELRNSIVGIHKMLTVLIDRLQQICNICTSTKDLDEIERVNLTSKCVDILHQAFKFGFEMYTQRHYDLLQFKAEDNTNDEHFQRGIADAYQPFIYFAKLWIDFVMKRCERGRGKRPRWAIHGFEFLSICVEPQYTKNLTDCEFEEFKNQIENCIKHVIGTMSTPSPDVFINNRLSFTRPRTPSTASSGIRQRPSFSQYIKENADKYLNPSSSELDSPDSGLANSPNFDRKSYTQSANHLKPVRSDRIKDSINKLERDLDEKLRANELIGQVTATPSVDRVYIKSRLVTFSWQRGIKIGQGRFGKVYTAVNNETGEMLAMKEIQLQPNDHKMLKRVAEEIKIFEGIKHNHLVRYYGVEIHREEMLIFMEFCAEGTLEQLVATTDIGLAEPTIRQYTRQLLSAIGMLHYHSVAHRDIKSANIFLTNKGNCIKLGDFGSAVKIKAHTTVPGELQAYVGTQAYMAPEVFMKTNADGHGRAADIWSLGCVIIEMASGKRPWSNFDSNYQIMFTVGMGERPEFPSRLSDEGVDFLEHCLQHDPKQRETAVNLLQHNFVKIDELYLK